MITRFPDWDRRMNDAIAAKRNTTFGRGSNDCVRFVCDIVQAFTGVDLCVGFRDLYKSDLDAIRLIRSWGQDGFFKTVDKVCTNAGLIRVEPKLAHRGDIMFFRKEGHEALAICVGPVSFTPGKDGIKAFPTREARCGWRISYGS